MDTASQTPDLSTQKINFCNSQMVNKKEVTKEIFEMLLKWLDPDPETAGQKYEKIRERLIRLLVCRGCFEAEDLADEAINRVTHKLPQLIDNYVGEPVLYFYGVADKVHLEWLRSEKKKKNLHFPGINYKVEPDSTPESELEYMCLETCLEVLQAKSRELIVEYYKEDKRAKIELRKKMAETLGITISALQIKTCRIRAVLLQCLQNCIKARAF